MIAVLIILILRWIPFSQVLLGREIVLLALSVAIVIILGRTPFAVAVAVVAALLTPAVPLRTMAVPVLVLFVALLARMFGMPRLRLALPSAIVVALPLLFFAWSGLVARALPYLVKPVPHVGEKYTVGYALPANSSALIEVPEHARALIVSGANVAGFRRGKVLGRVDDREIRIGDTADWGYLRRDHYYRSRNPLPRDPVGTIRGYGYTAWLDSASRVPIRRGARLIRVAADPALPPGASLQVEGFEIVRP